MNPLVHLLAILSLGGLSYGAPGLCPVQPEPVDIGDLGQMMGLWWRPYRSIISPQDPPYKCLSTTWTNLRDGQFDLVDYNVNADTDEKFNWTGKINTLDKLGNWDVQFDASQNFTRFTAQIIDYEKDEYALMYTCKVDDVDSHTEIGILFVKDPNISSDDLQKFLARAEHVMVMKMLFYVDMRPASLFNCPDPRKYN